MSHIVIHRDHPAHPRRGAQAAETLAVQLARRYDLSHHWQDDTLYLNAPASVARSNWSQAELRINVRLGFLPGDAKNTSWTGNSRLPGRAVSSKRTVRSGLSPYRIAHIGGWESMPWPVECRSPTSASAQLVPQDRADVGFGQAIAELDLARPLVGGETLSAVRLNGFDGQFHPGLGTTNTLIAEPLFSSGTPIQAASSTPRTSHHHLLDFTGNTSKPDTESGRFL